MAAPASSLRIASFNLENFPGEPGADRAGRYAILRPQLERLHADILCLQEVDAEKGGDGVRSIEALRDLLAETCYRDHHLAFTAGDEPGIPRDKHNLVVLSRWPITQTAQYAHDLVPPPRYRPVTADPPAAGEDAVHWDRPILEIRVALPAGPMLHVFNLHLRAPLLPPLPGRRSGRSLGGPSQAGRRASISRR
jgi:endonuclease/exonuclease/phosphatase family metal-dependent hydrolase